MLEVCLQAVLVQAEPIEDVAEGVGRQLLHGGLHLVAAAGGGAGEGVAPACVFLQAGPERKYFSQLSPSLSDCYLQKLWRQLGRTLASCRGPWQREQLRVESVAPEMLPEAGRVEGSTQH